MQGYSLKIFDKAGNLVDIPTDHIDVDLETIINGGSGSGYITFPRRFNSIGAIADGYRFQVYLPGSTDPWYDGRVTKIDRLQQYATRADIKAYVEGWMTAMDYDVVSEIITPGVQPNGVDNGQLDAGIYLTHLANTYLPGPPNQVPVSFSFSGSSSIGANLDRMQFDAQGLGRVCDDVIKAILDNQNRIWEWLVYGKADKSINFTWRPEQNPNITGGATFLYLDQTKYDQYQIVDDYTRIINQIVAYGGKDPFTGMTVWGAYNNSASQTTYGLRQGKITRPSAVSQTQLNMFATAYLNLYASPTQSGQFRLLNPDATATAGKWVQIQETPSFARQMKLLRVNLKIQSQRIQQICYVGLPLPSAEKLAQGPDPSGSYNASRLGASTPSMVQTNTDCVLGGINPSWTGGAATVTYSPGYARVSNTTVLIATKQNIALSNGAWSITMNSSGVLSVVAASVAAVPGTLVLDDFNVSSGKIIGWWPRAPRGGADTSTNSKYQASIPPIVSDVVISSSATAGIGTSSAVITVSWTAGTIYWPDGSSTPISSGSQQFTGLFTSTTYYFYGVWWTATYETVDGIGFNPGVVVPLPRVTVPSIQQKQTPNIDGNVGFSSSFSITTPAPNGSSTGGGGHTNTCPASWQLVETRERGFIPASDLRVGEHVRDPEDGWNRIEVLAPDKADIYAVSLDGEEVFVDENHSWLAADGKTWICMRDLTLTTPLLRVDGRVSFARSIERLGEAEYVRVTCERHRFVLGRHIGHNFPIVTN